MRYNYKIILDINQDIWNWYDGCKGSFFGVSWKDRVPANLYKNIKNKTKKEVYGFLEKYLKEEYILKKETIDGHIKFLDDIYSTKFNQACNKIVEITKHELKIKEYTIFITTFPRGPYDFGKGYLWEYIGWNNPIMGLMHELLHFQFHHYWRKDPKSLVSKLDENSFQFLKESLTVILDQEMMPLIEYADKGYPDHQKFRKLLHNNWRKNHDFDKLVGFGLKKLPEYCKN